ncbi:hypothetical protein HYI36_20320 [Bacillus sp. Gen3]|nr:hypothetical protein [Bacillus sp. Gen3]
MITNLFGRKNSLEDMVTELVVKVDTQTTQITEQAGIITGLTKTIAIMRSYLEASESRTKHDIAQNIQSIKQEVVERISEIDLKISKIKPGSSATEVVKQISKSSEEEQTLKRLKALVSQLNRILVENIIDGLPLYTVNSSSKHPFLTKQGRTIYDAWGKTASNLAKICGCNKEAFTNAKKYDEFFKSIRTKNYDKMSANYTDKKTVKTKYAAVILQGHAKEYTQFLLELVKKEIDRIQ